ncbi:MAG: polysaccharide biosynthesis/export family protein [Thermodesulfobacteriota bacterium]
MKQVKGCRGMQVVAVLSLMAFLSTLAGCTSASIKAKPLEGGQQLPTSQSATETRTTQPYVLDVGDEVTIKVWGFDDLQKTTIINSSGDIYYPMLGRLQLAGKTIPQAQEMLTAKLQRYVVDPQVDVTSTTGRFEVFVLGEVTTPGRYTYTRPLRVMEAIGRAGWFNEHANKSNVLLVRRAKDRFNVYQINANAVLKDESPAPQSYLLQPGDLVIVPPTAMRDIARFMNNIQAILQPFMTIEQMVVLWPAFRNAVETGGAGLSISTTTPAATSQ